MKEKRNAQEVKRRSTHKLFGMPEIGLRIDWRES
jgi:hypothetical protein